MEKRAIIHVENTENVLELAQYLVSSGWTILSANKTEDLLRKQKIPVTHEPALVENNVYVNDLSHLVKKVIMSKYNQPNEYLGELDENNIYLVCINVTPLMNTSMVTKQLETNIKPANFFVTNLLRNAFVNYENVLILTDPDDYKEALIQLKTNNITKEFRSYLAAKSINLISAYDAGLSASILQNSQNKITFLNYLMYPYKKQLQLQEGSNSQQNGYLYKSPTDTGALNGFLKLQGKELTYNIISDVSYAWSQISNLYTFLKSQYTVKSTNSDGYDFTTQFTPLTGTVFTVAVKFNSIIGAALSTNVLDSYRMTHSYNTEYIKEAILACSSVIDENAAKEIIQGDFVAVVAPGFTDEAKTVLSSNKNIRLIPSAKVANISLEAQLINGGILLQTRDGELFNHWNVKTKNRPSQFKTDEMAFGMLLAMGARSYSAVIIKQNSIVGIAQSCPSTIQAVESATLDAEKHACESEEPIGDILVCDSAIPFGDTVKKLLDKGITAIIQTGGTSTDNEFINYCDERGIVMVFTNMTHISF